MKNTMVNANFPRSVDQRVYHLGVRPGEVANRIATLGTPSRAEALASFLDDTPKPFKLESERGFLTITGRYKSVPVSIVSIGMGSPNMDFFVREMRESVIGDMVIIRLGSCGALADIPVSSVVVPEQSIQIHRNVDFDFTHPDNNNTDEPAYRVSKPIRNSQNGWHTTNASADSFYSSQGRLTSFEDYNVNLIDDLQTSVQNLTTIEMESFHLFHLAACWNAQVTSRSNTNPVDPSLLDSESSSQQIECFPSVIRAAAAHMVFASRTSQDFITPQEVMELERWTGQAVLETLVKTEISEHGLHEESGAVWEILN